jgi:oxygen-independent coproporphyrinogen-3 oxidase
MPPAQPESGAGLYIHVPFCASVCPYCDFAVTIAGEERRDGWVEGVLREAAIHRDIGLTFDTVYFGGGTPSCLSPNQILRVVEGVNRHLDIESGASVFLEANPEDVNFEKASVWKDLGCLFISLGVQSFDDEDLLSLGRKHDAADARRAVDVLLETGFESVSVDLIYGLEGRSRNHWRRQLESAVACGAHHLSCYQLTVHDGTLFGRRVACGDAKEIDEQEIAALFFLTHELLSDAGYQAYEVSNFAMSLEHRSRHNQKYWNHTPYLGLGPSAHSFAHGRRWWNQRKLRLWHNALASGESPVEDEERPSPEELVLEALMLGFRTTAGVDVGRLRHCLEIDFLAQNRAVIDRLSSSGHLEVDGDMLRPSLAGLAIADTLARSFVV